ncbi:hypothetical protein EDD27_5995 [Nonomuraea polychroma]|uniref:Uncharacterized protein n=1 Tax=Nonomuraea polychroma TaxID=46176 RepID=A0A438MCA7_9ACTN|nr:hypothetical protein [Nonomuraea polychroma]RVX43318.1 hypothetical protein EDD27_5995 [Nonomuraea polychroma]
MRYKSAAILSALVLTFGIGGAATVSAAAPAKPNQYGVCVNAKTGGMRLLEPLNLRRSQFSKCKSSERRVFLPTKHAIPVALLVPATVVFKRGGAVETCTKTTDTTLTYECETVPPRPPPRPARTEEDS